MKYIQFSESFSDGILLISISWGECHTSFWKTLELTIEVAIANSVLILPRVFSGIAKREVFKHVQGYYSEFQPGLMVADTVVLFFLDDSQAFPRSNGFEF